MAIGHQRTRLDGTLHRYSSLSTGQRVRAYHHPILARNGKVLIRLVPEIVMAHGALSPSCAWMLGELHGLSEIRTAAGQPLAFTLLPQARTDTLAVCTHVCTHAYTHACTHVCAHAYTPSLHGALCGLRETRTTTRQPRPFHSGAAGA